MKLPVRAVVGHMLSELLVHGHDIASAERRRFELPPAYVLHVFDSFLLELLANDDAARFAGARADDAKPVTCELRLRGSDPVVLVADGETLAVEAPGARRVDVHVAADPAVMWLLMCGRIGRLQAIRRRGVVVWGPRPWRLRRLEQLLHTP